MQKSDSNVISVLKNDGIDNINENSLRKYENVTTINISKLRKEYGNGSWAVRIAYNERFGGVVIQQQPGEGNRKHYHPDADENWVILEGKWEWYIDGKKNTVEKGDLVVVKKNTWHQIKCIGNSPGVRYAITKPDVEHIYED